MAIIFNPNKKIFTLQTAHTTYQMQVDRLGYLLHLYYGAKSTCDMDYGLRLCRATLRLSYDFRPNDFTTFRRGSATLTELPISRSGVGGFFFPG